MSLPVLERQDGMSLESATLVAIRRILVAKGGELRPDGRYVGEGFIVWFDGSVLGTGMTIIRPKTSTLRVDVFDFHPETNLKVYRLNADTTTVEEVERLLGSTIGGD